MATFRPGTPMKKQRLYIASAFEVPKTGAKEGEKPSHYDVALSIANDLADPKKENAVMTDPMLAYNSYEKDGQKRTSHTMRYAASQYEAMLAASNKEGDKDVFVADLFVAGKNNNKKRGLLVNTKTLETPQEKFDHAKHKENTQEARDIKKAAKEAAKQEAAAQEPEKENAAEPVSEQQELEV